MVCGVILYRNFSRYVSTFSRFTLNFFLLMKNVVLYMCLTMPCPLTASLTQTHAWQSEEILRLNPRGELPILTDVESTLHEEAAMLQYIEWTYPTPPLTPRLVVTSRLNNSTNKQTQSFVSTLFFWNLLCILFDIWRASCIIIIIIVWKRIRRTGLKLLLYSMKLLVPLQTLASPFLFTC